MMKNVKMEPLLEEYKNENYDNHIRIRPSVPNAIKLTSTVLD